MNDFQSYLLDMLWEAGEKQAKTMTKFNEYEMWRIFDGCFHQLYQSKHTHLNWGILEQTYQESVSKIESVKNNIIQERYQEDRLSKLENEPATSNKMH